MKSQPSAPSQQVLAVSEVERLSSAHGSEKLGSEKPSSVVSSAKMQSAKSGSSPFEMFGENPVVQQTGMLSQFAVATFLKHL